jgi:hypothetical protein
VLGCKSGEPVFALWRMASPETARRRLHAKEAVDAIFYGRRVVAKANKPGLPLDGRLYTARALGSDASGRSARQGDYGADGNPIVANAALRRNIPRPPRTD